MTASAQSAQQPSPHTQLEQDAWHNNNVEQVSPQDSDWQRFKAIAAQPIPVKQGKT